MRRLLGALLVCCPAVAQETLVSAHAGEVPIILSAPHGGRLPIPGVPERQNRAVAGFVTVGDVYTAELAQEVAAAMKRRPYTVVAGFHRRFLDANRPLSGAAESPLAEPVYQQYHGALANYSEEVQRRWGRGLVVDIHGQKAEPDGIFRGTQNGRTVATLVRRHGPAAVEGPSSVLGVLATLGYRILPLEFVAPENDSFDGGYIVQTYGGGPIDALQLEFGRELRSPAQLRRTANNLAQALDTFLAAYLQEH
jgi:N-formylglutamate amidohydrolase